MFLSFATFFFLIPSQPPKSTLFPYTTLFRSSHARGDNPVAGHQPPKAIASRKGSRLPGASRDAALDPRSEEHTSELQSLTNLVCRLLLEKKKRQQFLELHRSINSTESTAEND